VTSSVDEHPDSWRAANDLTSDYAAAVVIARRPSQGGPVNHASGLIATVDGHHVFLTGAHVITEWTRRTVADPTLNAPFKTVTAYKATGHPCCTIQVVAPPGGSSAPRGRGLA
jgi:hypothetical protein